jgi:transcriptional regulator of acetoin/glycerol metabolism
MLVQSDLPPEVFDGPEDGETVLEHNVSSMPPQSAPADAAALPADAQRLLHALALTGGQREAAAHMLGMSRVTLWRRMKSFGLV